ncbi:MAG: histidine phosphatase family protein [Clostridiales bacterium]|nr:histidine phosphatase family protein [Clostridiales bacterium]
MKITIIRHAEPDYENNTLTEKGFKEADILGNYLKNEKIDYIYSSPLNRAKFTADAIVKYNKTKTYKVLDFLAEFEPDMWDNAPSFLASDEKLYDKNRWLEVDFNGLNDQIKSRYAFVKQELSELLQKHGYRKNGAYYDVLNANKDNIVLTCHFGLESYLLSELLNVPLVAIINHTCAAPSSITTVVTEEREKGKAIFRMLSYGETTHLKMAGEPVSFMARYAEVYGDGDRVLI